MKKGRNKIIAIILAVTVFFSLQIVVFASNSWSDSGTFSLNSDTGWKRTTTKGERLLDVKTTTSTSVTVYTLSKTMSSYPQFRMVNSNNSARSASFSVPSAGQQKTSKSNTGEKGYKYYASVKSAWNQVTDNQSVRIKFMSH